MATYRSTYGLPACTTANGCFKKVNQNGVQGSYPTNDQGWALETQLDLEMVSADLPRLQDPAGGGDLQRQRQPVRGGGHRGQAGRHRDLQQLRRRRVELRDDRRRPLQPPGRGDHRLLGRQRVRRRVPGGLAVRDRGRRHLAQPRINARGWTETAWSGSGSGCSAYEPKPAWQTDSGCARRTVADVSAVADPNTGVAVYDSNCNIVGQILGQCFKGWGVVGGTSASAPIVAGVYGLAGNGSSVNYGSFPYSHTSSLFDVTSGNNGSCSSAYLCTSGAGYDGPTAWDPERDRRLLAAPGRSSTREEAPVRGPLRLCGERG